MKNNIFTLACILIGSLLLQGLALAGSNKVTYYVPDALGSPIAAMDEEGNVKWRKHYAPYGEDLNQDEESKDNRIGYTGHAHDRDSGLTYMGARYYDPTIGRFMGMDPVGFDESNPVSMNRYAYANNNPYSYIDPDGRSPKRNLRGPNSMPWGPENAGGGMSGAGARGHTKINFSKVWKNLFSGNKSFLRNKLKRINNQTAAGGNRGVTGSVSNKQAMILGKRFVGLDFKTMSNGKGLVSANGLRTFRFPAAKKGTNPATGQPWSKTGTQANFETKVARGETPISNVHLDVK